MYMIEVKVRFKGDFIPVDIEDFFNEIALGNKYLIQQYDVITLGGSFNNCKEEIVVEISKPLT